MPRKKVNNNPNHAKIRKARIAEKKANPSAQSESIPLAARMGAPVDPKKHLQGKTLTANEVRMLRVAMAEELCIKSLYEFLQVAWRFVEPGMALNLNWHIETVARELEVVYPGVRQEDPPFGWDVYVLGDPPALGDGGRPEGYLPGDVLEVFETRREAEAFMRTPRELYAGQEVKGELGIRASGGVSLVEENWRAYVPEPVRPKPLWRNSRLIINIPPGHMKSLLVSVFWPAWVMLHDPGHRTLSISGSDKIAIRDSMRTRQILDTNWYRKLVRRHALNLKRSWTEIEENLNPAQKVHVVRGEQQEVRDVMTSVRRGVLGSYALAPDGNAEPWNISTKKDAKASFGTTLLGYRESKALGSRITGERGYGWTLDDPIDVKEIMTHGQVDNEAVSARCKNVVSTIDQVLDSRVNDMRPGRFYNVIIMQRLHVDDPPGTFYRRMREGGDFWRFVVARSRHVPDAELDVDEPPNHPDDPRTPGGYRRRCLKRGVDIDPEWEEQAGALLFEARFPGAVIDGIERRLGDQFNAQHQQNPLPGKGGMMADALQRVRRYVQDPHLVAEGNAHLATQTGAPLGRLELLMAVDATFGSKGATASNVAVQVWGRPYTGAARGLMVLLDSVADRMSYTETEDAILQMKRKWPRVRTILIEKKANGATLIERLASRVNGIEEYDPDGSKEVRAAVLAANMKTGSVLIPAGDPRDPNALRNGYTPWIDAYITELARFPGGARNDRVDASSSAVIYWTEGSTPDNGGDFEEKFRSAVKRVGNVIESNGASWVLPF